MSATGFEGSTLEYRFVSPVMPGVDVVKPFTEQPGQDLNFLVSGDFDVGAFNVSSRIIRFDMNSSFGISFAPGDKFVISDIGVDDVPDIVGFTMSTSVSWLTTSDISFTAQSITITIPGAFDWYPAQYLEISVMFSTDSHSPDPDPDPKPQPTKLTGTNGNDFLAGTNGRDLIDGGAGNDSIFAGNDNDIVNGGAGDDLIGGGTGADKLNGDAGNDVIFGGNGNDQIFGGDGNDVAWGGKGADVIKGDAGDDLLGGGLGRDALYGGDGADTLFGGADNDRLYGDAGNDKLYGGAGDDYLTGGKGNDFVSGGAGADTFVFGKNEGDDVLRDFNGKDGDQIDLGNQTYEVVENEDGFAVLELSGGGSITLNGIGIDDVIADWFLAA